MANNYATNFRDILKQNTVENTVDPELSTVSIGSNIGKAFDNVNTAVKQSGIHALDNVMSQYTNADELGKAYADGSLNKAFGSFNKLDSAAMDELVKAKQKQLFNATEQAKTDEITSRTNDEKLNQSRESIGVKQLKNKIAKYDNIDQFNQAVANGEITNVDGVSQATFANTINAGRDALRNSFVTAEKFNNVVKDANYKKQATTLESELVKQMHDATFEGDSVNAEKVIDNKLAGLPAEYANPIREKALGIFKTLRTASGENKNNFNVINNNIANSKEVLKSNFTNAEMDLQRKHNIDPNYQHIQDLSDKEAASRIKAMKEIFGKEGDDALIDEGSYKTLMAEFKLQTGKTSTSNKDVLGLLEVYKSSIGDHNVKDIVSSYVTLQKANKGKYEAYHSDLSKLTQRFNKANKQLNALQVKASTATQKLALANSNKGTKVSINPNDYDTKSAVDTFLEDTDGTRYSETKNSTIATQASQIETLKKQVKTLSDSLLKQTKVDNKTKAEKAAATSRAMAKSYSYNK